LHPDQVDGFRDNLTGFRRRLAKTAFAPQGMDGIGDTNAASTNLAPLQ
jgi:hypothetical protein